MGASEIRFESRTVIARPVSEVFERLADLPGYGRWMSGGGLFRRSELSSDLPIRVGTTYVDVTWMGTFRGEVVELAPPNRIAFTETMSWFGRPLTTARPAYVLEAEGDSTVVHHVAVGELYGVMRAFKPVAGWLAQRERTRTVECLARSLEDGR